MVLEPLRIRRDGANLRGLARVLVADDALPRSLRAARIDVYLHERVDSIDRRLRVRDPGDVVGHAILAGARAIEANLRLKGAPHRLACERQRGLEMSDDAREFRGVQPGRDAILRQSDAPRALLDVAVRTDHERGVQRVLLLETLEATQRHAGAVEGRR